MGHGQKIVDSLKEAVAGNFARVTVGGVTWVRNDTHVDKATAWDELAKKNAEIERLRAALKPFAEVARGDRLNPTPDEWQRASAVYQNTNEQNGDGK